MSGHRGLAAGLAWLGGADNDILDTVPTERGRYVQMALVLLTTSGIGTLSMMFALDDGVHTPLPVAIVGGIAWGFIILNIDRFLVLSMGHARDWKKLLLMTLPRLALAAVISVVVATPLTLRIFQHDINNQMMIQQNLESAQQSKNEQGTLLAQQLTKVNSQIKMWNQVLAGNLEGVTASTPQLAAAQQNVASLKTQTAAAQTTMDDAYDKWNCEVNGAGSGCAAGASSLAGDGPRAQDDWLAYTQAKASYDSLSGQLSAAEQQESADAKTASGNAKSSLASEQETAHAKLPGLMKQQASLQSEVDSQIQNNANSVNGNNGILAQLQALSDAGAQDPVLGVAQWVVTLLFFFIEILPVMVKFLLNVGPLSLYEVALKSEEDSKIDQFKTTRVTKRQDIEREALKQQAIDEDMRQREEALGKMANAHVAAHMEAILTQALRNWSTQVQSQLGGQVPGSAPVAGGTVPMRRITGAQRQLGITGPQPSLNSQNGSLNGQNGSHNGQNGFANGQNGIGYGAVGRQTNGADYVTGPTATYPAAPGAGSGFVLPTDDGDLL
ncbi:MAG TPA: DUF4407 domain-containing protein [Streptosporangiaceae bacterium]|nr:DUF4407 domain-containing protein [Streptosporangiaceae bacterium]